MSKWTNAFCTLIAASSLAFLSAASAAAQKASAPKTPDIVALGQPQVTQLLLLIESDSGKVSKEQWLKFMAEEFDRLDKAKTGQLNIKDLKESQTPPPRLAAVGK